MIVYDARLEEIRRKVEHGERLSAADGEYLYCDEVSLHAVGELADIACRRRHGSTVFYNINAHLNPTNVCVYRCALCAFSRDADDPRAYVMTMDESAEQAREAAAAGCTEIHIVGGVHPEKPFAWYRDLVAVVRRAAPTLHIKAFTAVEIAWFAQQTRRDIGRVLAELMAAGLASLPGGGAEIFDPEVRTRVCPRKADAKTWLDVHHVAHNIGLKSNATMLFGHLESVEHRIDHLIQLRQQQERSGGFQAFVPLSFHPAHTPLAHLPKTSPQDELRTVAVSRLMLDNFDHVKAYWVSLGVGTAQTALRYGANDFDGTVRRERIHHEAGSAAPQTLSVAEIEHLIRETGGTPVERDSLYRPVIRQDSPFPRVLSGR